jgi:hypothetical protein
MGNSGEKLVNGAINVKSGGDGDEILDLNLELGKVSWDVDLLENVSASVLGDDPALGGIVALGVGSLAVGHASEDVEDETTPRVELSVLLLDLRSGSNANFAKSETLSLGDKVVMSLMVGRSLTVSQGLLRSLGHSLSHLSSVVG